jgi:hypothetical protein
MNTLALPRKRTIRLALQLMFLVAFVIVTFLAPGL